MQITPHELDGVFTIELDRIEDPRGYFMRTYGRSVMADHGLQTDWEQESVSFNAKRHTVRGLHFQLPPYDETKIVRVIQGAVMDIFVDLRRASASYGRWGMIELSSENDLAVYIPKGFAHGFKSLVDGTTVAYKIDMPYRAEAAAGVLWNDPDIGIQWNVAEPVISDRDRNLPRFADFVSPF